MLMGVLVLLGWALGVETLKSVVPGLVTMKVNSALCFILGGLALISRLTPTPAIRWVSRGLALGMIALAAASAIEYIPGVDLRIDELFTRDPASLTHHLPPGRMALASALGFLCAGVSIGLAGIGRAILAQLLTFASIQIALFSLVAYLFGEGSVTMISPYTSLAVHTALGLFVLDVGILSLCVGAGPMAIFVANDPGGASLRRLLPSAVGITILIGLLVALGVEFGLYNFAAAFVLLSVATSGVLAVAVWNNSESLSQSDARRRRELERFRLTLTSIGDAVIATDGQGRVTFANDVAAGLTGWTGAEAAGRPLHEVFQIINEKSREPVANPVAQVLATGQTVELANHTILITRDGTERPIEDGAAPILDTDGSIAGVVLVFRDVAAKHRSTRMLEEQKHVLELIARGGDLHGVLDALCLLIEGQASEPLFASILIVSKDGTRWTLGAGPSLPDAYHRVVEGVAIAHGIASCGPTARRGEPVYVADIALDPLWGEFADLAESHGLRDCWSCPIVSNRNEVLGVFALYRSQPRLPSAEELKFVDIVTRTAAIALESDRNQAALLDTRGRLESALSAGSIGTWVWDLVTDDVVPDTNMERMFSLSPEQAAGGPPTHYLQMMHPEDRPGVEEALGEAIAVSGKYHAEYRIIQPDGSFLSVEARGVVQYDPTGRPLRMPGVVVDITERKRVEEEKRRADEEHRQLAIHSESQARLFESTLSNSPDIISMFDIQGCFTYANKSLLTLWQKSLDETVGKTFFDLDYPTEMAARLHNQVLEVVTSKTKVVGEMEYTSATGKRSYEHIFAPVLAPDGSVEAVVGSSRDITHRQENEAATRLRANQMQKLAEISTRINAAHDVNSVVRVVAAEALGLFGTDRAAISMILNPDFPQPINVVAIWGAEPVVYEPPDLDQTMMIELLPEVGDPVRLVGAEVEADTRWRAFRRLGGDQPVGNGWLAVPLVSRDGKSMGMIQLADKRDGVFSVEDEALVVQLSHLAAIAIENARLYEELRGNDQRKDEFLAMLAHELRNPLAAVSNAVQILTRTSFAEHGEWSLGIIHRQMRHLTRLIDDLLDASRISRGKIELRRVLIDVAPILESAALTVRALVDERKHTLDLRVDRENLWVHADPTRLEQVVVNLLNNAAKYSENAGKIELEGRVEGDHVVIQVTDQGIGIPPDKLPRMFEMFAQGDRSLARSEGGLGIGLTVVKKLVELHGGTINARSEGTGQGSEFTVRLATAPRPSETAPVTPTAPATPTEPRLIRILVVDDNVDTARGMARLLKLLGHDVATAHSGPEAIEAARRHRPEVVLLDIGLPGMSGYEVAARLRQEDSCQGAFIIAVSGYGQDDDRRRSREAGFDHHLIKPLDHDALLAILGNT